MVHYQPLLCTFRFRMPCKGHHPPPRNRPCTCSPSAHRFREEMSHALGNSDKMMHRGPLKMSQQHTARKGHHEDWRIQEHTDNYAGIHSLCLIGCWLDTGCTLHFLRRSCRFQRGMQSTHHCPMYTRAHMCNLNLPNLSHFWPDRSHTHQIPLTT